MGLLPIPDSRRSPEVLVHDDPHPVRIEESELLRTPGSPFPGLHRMTEGAPGFELPIERINNPDANPDLGSGDGFELLGIPTLEMDRQAVPHPNGVARCCSWVPASREFNRTAGRFDGCDQGCRAPADREPDLEGFETSEYRLGVGMCGLQ